MKLNNKGFAITTILYGTLILFLMLLLSMLGILSTYKERLGMLIDNNNGARCIINRNCEGSTDDNPLIGNLPDNPPIQIIPPSDEITPITPIVPGVEDVIS